MKKIYASIFAVALASSVLAQTKTQDIQPAGKNTTFSNKVLPSNVRTLKGANIWSNSCDDIADWTLTNTSSPALDWSYETDAMIAPRAEFQPLGFTTVSDGFLFINSDAAGAGATQNAIIEIANSIDLSAENDVVLSFQQAYRNYQEKRTVSVSGDNGATWTDFVIHDGSSDVNANTANPETYIINISAVAGGQSNVLFRFKYEGTFDWFWAIDDVSINVLDDNDLKAKTNFFGTNGPWGALLPYYQIPSAQVTAIEFGSVVDNIGKVAQPNTVLNVTTGAFTGTSAMSFSSLPGASDTVMATTAFTPAAAVANHTVNYVVSSDSTDVNPSDNSGVMEFAVSQYIFARDNGTSDGGSYNSGEAYEVGNIFDITTTADIYAIDVQISGSSEVGAQFSTVLYSIEPSDGSFVTMAESQDYTITQSDIDNNAVITMVLDLKQTLNGGESYLVVSRAYGDGGATNDVVVSTGGSSEDQTTYYFDGTDNTWYYTTSTPAVRMNFDMSLGVEENALTMELGQNFPNPFNGVTTISYSLTSNETISIEVTDVAGKVITVLNEGTKGAGTYTTTFNSSDLEAGVYFYTLSNGTSSTTKTMTITK